MDDRRAKRGLRSRNAERSEDEKPPRPTGAPATGGGGIFKSAAVAVLRQHRKLMTTGDITRLAVEMGLLKCQGKTPEATMASALYTDVKRKLQKSLFTRPQEGLFGLREWLEEGYYPEGWVGPPDGLGLAPFKRRNNAGSHQGVSAPTAASKAGRQGVRTGPGRTSKARAARSWRNAGSDAEDDDIMDDDDDQTPTGRSQPSGPLTAAAGMSSAAGAVAAGDEDEADEGMGEGEDMEVEEEAEDGDEAMEGAVEGPEERPDGRQAGEEAGTAADPRAVGGKDAGAAAGGACGRSQHGQPTASPARRSARGRAGGSGGGEGVVPQDDCLSPLQLLGEAAASESMSDLGGDHRGSPPSKRKRPSNITVPDRAGGLGGVEGATPRSPYEDSLAALHEIATSPSTFELTSQREQHAGSTRGGGEVGSGKVGRTRPRLHVDVPNNAVEGPSSRRDGTPGTTLLTDNPMLQGETTPAILLQASPVTTADGQQAMMLRQAPVLVTLPPALASPTAAIGGQLDTPALLHVQLPGGAPSELMQTTLITPTGQQLTPLRAHQGVFATGGRGGLLKVEGGPPTSRPPGRRVSFSGQVGILGPPSTSVPQLHQPLQPPAGFQGGAAADTAAALGLQDAAAAGGHAWPPRLTPAQVESELTEVARMKTVVERLESKLGNSHPQMGKAWLAISRMYQHIGEAEHNNGSSCMNSMARAAEALQRAWAVCRACAESCGTTVQCEEAFRYLTARTSEAALEGEGAADGDATAIMESGLAGDGKDGAHASPAAVSGSEAQQEPASAVEQGNRGGPDVASAQQGDGSRDQQLQREVKDPMAMDGPGAEASPTVTAQG